MLTQLTGGERRQTMSDLTIKYKDNPITELSESGTKTLKTAGKYCEGDITVEYSKPAGGVDMGITGATVGQIAKIAAVDASGVPTAWEPVDMPTGMPSVTAADNGKFLRVVSGAWAVAAINDANGVNF